MAEVARIIRKDYIKFLGTAGARFVMIRQLRSSAGIWVNAGGTNVIIDPGPGSIVRCAMSRPRLDPTDLSGIIVTHRHLDHSGDINVMIEAMTEGGFKKRGLVYCPRDALGADSVIMRHALKFPEAVKTLQARKKIVIGKVTFETSPRHIHPVETYGLKFAIHGAKIALLTDTRMSSALAGFYRSDILIIAVVFLQPRAGIDHLSLLDARTLIQALKPAKTILTHFGMSMLTARPHIQAAKLTQELGREVIAAYDGMTLNF
jgi:ribonuclease BN (tRNA processing enzyme)